MKNYMLHGDAPYEIVVVHGGPGAFGGMRATAVELSKTKGVIEAIQTVDSVDAQIEELAQVIREQADGKVHAVGHSWGAWLVLLLAERYPELVKKLYLVCSGPFIAKYAESITPTRLSRLTDEERVTVAELKQQLKSESGHNKDDLLLEYAYLSCKGDNYNAITESYPAEGFSSEIHVKVWEEAAEIRRDGSLMKSLEKVTCPIVIIHGDWDPHPWEGVYFPISDLGLDYEFYLLDNCGHEPWREVDALEEYFAILINSVED